MSSPIPIPIRYPSHSGASSPGLYVPVHRRAPGSYASSSSRTPSPSPSHSPSPTYLALNLHTPTSASIPGVYTPAELLLLSTSPLAKLSVDDVDALRTLAPEVVRTRKQLKTLVWHARHPHHPTDLDLPRSHGRTSSHGSHASESEEDRATSWRRI